MNSSTQRIINIIIDSSIIILSSANIYISTGIFGFIAYHLIIKRNSPHHVSLLLTANMYLALLFSGIMFLEQYTRALLGHLYSLSSLHDGICPIRAYFLWVSVCGVLYSNTLQGIYRLCRVVFYTKQSLQSFQLYQILIIIQWIICLLMMIPSLLLDDFKYSVDNYSCQNGYKNLRNTFVNVSLCYVIPMCITVGCYFYTLKKVRRRNNSLVQTITQIQQINARRDLVVIFRICIILGLLMADAIPTAITLLISKFTGFIPWWSLQTQWLVFTLSTTTVSVVSALISPHLRDLWIASGQVKPTRVGIN